MSGLTQQAVEREHLTQQLVERATPPPKGPGGKHTTRFIRDDKVRGFVLRILDSGTKTFLLQARINKKPRWISIGRHPDWTVTQARDKAEALRAEIAHGGDPTVEKQGEAAEPTFGDLCEAYYKHAEVRGKKSVDCVRKRIATHCAAWLAHKASQITKNEIAELHDRIGADYRSLANSVSDHVKAVFNHAIKRDLFKGENPARGTDRFEEVKRQRFLSLEELKRVNAALLEEPDWRHRAFFPLSVLTGARKGEWLAARWKDIDLTKGTWEKPVTKTVPQLMPLPQAAIAILEGLPSSGKSPWVFPGKGKRGHLRDVLEAWKRIRERAEVPDCRVHDLRHSFASSMVGRGVPIQMVGKLLNHASIATTQRYAHLALDTQRTAIDANADALAIAFAPAK